LEGPRPTLRLDRWLVFARLARTRSVAAAMVEAGHLRVNGQRVQRPAQAVGPGDVLTLPQGARIRLLRIVACGARRGPPAEAAALYCDLDADPPPGDGVPPRPRGAERAS